MSQPRIPGQVPDRQATGQRVAAQPELPWVRGVLVTLVAGPVLVVGGLIALSALLSMFIAGWIPSNWFSGSAADFAFGAGVRGDAANYARFMLGGAPAALAWAAIRWAWEPKS